MSFNTAVVKAAQSTVVALSTKVTGSVTAGPTFAVGGVNQAEWESLVANVSAAITTTALVATTSWQVSNDAVTWLPLFGMNSPANVAVAPAGTGGAIVTAYAQACPLNVPYPYARMVVTNTGATGGAADIVTISYNFKKRVGQL